MFIKKLAYAKDIKISKCFDVNDAIIVVNSQAKIFIPMKDLIDKEFELSRLNKEYEKLQNELNINLSKLNNKNFLSKAPEQVVKSVKKNVDDLNEKFINLKKSLEELNKRK